jgi:hypothetical protein
MGEALSFRPAADRRALAEDLARLCRGLLLERPGRPVALDRLATLTGEDPERVRDAVGLLERSGRAGVGVYAMRWRPGVRVVAVDRIDGVGAGG